MEQMSRHAGDLFINPLIYAELCYRADSAEQDQCVSLLGFLWEDLPRAALCLAARAYRTYRQRGGVNTAPLPDFFIGAHSEEPDFSILINGVPCVQIELKTLGIQPRRVMEQIVNYKNDPGNGYTGPLLCFLQIFIVNNRDSTYYYANNNNTRHLAFNADTAMRDSAIHSREASLRSLSKAKDNRYLPIYQFAA